MQIKEKNLFLKGISFFNNNNYYQAHEEWEDLWVNYKLKDPLLIQGLIQLSVGYFHITNSNIKGSLSLFKKSIPKLEKYLVNDYKLNICYIVEQVNLTIENLNSIKMTNEFNWALAPKISLKQ